MTIVSEEIQKPVESTPAAAAFPEAPQVAPQVSIPAGEDGGYKAPGGGPRKSIRERIAAIRPYSSDTIDVAAWDNVTIEVRSIPLGERNDMLMRVMDPETNKPDVKKLYPELLIETCFDPETGEKVFSDDDAAFINGRDSAAVDPVAKLALRISGMDDGAEEEAAGKSSKTETSV